MICAPDDNDNDNDKWLESERRSKMKAKLVYRKMQIEIEALAGELQNMTLGPDADGDAAADAAAADEIPEDVEMVYVELEAVEADEADQADEAEQAVEADVVAECIICTDVLNPLRNRAILPCGHELCLTCLIRHVSYDVRCPFCRHIIIEVVTEDEIAGMEV